MSAHTTNGDFEADKRNWIAAVTIWSAGLLFQSILAIYHLYNTYLDLYTTDRKSVSHRRKAPTITKFYKHVAFSTNFSIFCYLLCMIFGFWGNFTETDSACYVDNVLWAASVQMAKGAMYCIFLLKLHIIYNISNSTFRYDVRKLLLVSLIVVLVTIIIIIAEIDGFIAKVISYSFAEPAFFCSGTLPIWILIVAGLLDIVLSIGFLASFALPLRKAIKDYLSDSKLSSSLSDRTKSKIIFTGMKYKILIFVSTISTLIAILVFGFVGTVFPAVADFIINSICLMLMTQYYPDVIFYTKLCCCCMLCCDRHEYSKESQWEPRKLSDQGMTEPPDSIDTGDALRVLSEHARQHYQQKDEQQLAQNIDHHTAPAAATDANHADINDTPAADAES